MNKVRIQKVLVKELHRFALDFLSKAADDEVVPISLQRALAHSQNPCASNDDVGLLVAYVDEKCVGFQGILPGWLKTSEGQKKIYWISSLYIAPEHRGAGVYREILKSQLSLDYDFFYTGLSADIISVLRGLRVEEIPPLRHLYLNLDRFADFLNIPARIVRKIFKLIKKRTPLIDRWILWVQKQVRTYRQKFYRRLLKSYQTILQEFSWKETEAIETEWCSRKREGVHFEHDAATLNWMLKVPWLSSNDGRYYFGQTSGDWGKHCAIEVLDKTDGTHRGVVVLYIASRGGNSLVRVLDCFFKNENDKRIIFPIALEYARKVNAKIVEFSQDLSSSSYLSFFTRLLLQQGSGTYFCMLKKNSLVASDMRTLHLELGDGDTAFV